MDRLPRLGKRELQCLLLFTCNYVVSVWRGFLFLWVLGMGYVILLWHSLSLPYNNFTNSQNMVNRTVSKTLSTKQPKPNYKHTVKHRRNSNTKNRHRTTALEQSVMNYYGWCFNWVTTATLLSVSEVVWGCSSFHKMLY